MKPSVRPERPRASAASRTGVEGRHLLALAALALAACFSPTFNNPTCGPNGECPSGTTCVQDVCRSDVPGIDAPIDTPDIDSPPGDPDAAIPDGAPNDGQPDAPIDASIDARIDAPTDAATDAPTDGPPIDATMTCGNGFLEGTEQCDDSNTVNTDDCTGICRVNVCGDGFTDTVGSRTDTCDDGNSSNTDNCVNVSSQCRPSSCGDGYTDMATPGIEQCDDGNANNADGCKNNCTLPMCGDGVTSIGEQCDDGNLNNGDNCLNSCLNATCGDGFIDTVSPGIESCDDDGNVSGDGCSSTCGVESGYSCSGQPSVCMMLCGNGVVEAGENCDDGNPLACGTCSAGCTTSIMAAAATGSITCATGSVQNDGETFTLNDGINPPITFEWDRDGNFTPGFVQAPFQTFWGQGQIAMQTRDVINSIPNNLLITATHSGGPTLFLTHDRQTALGNRPIQHNVTNAQFQASGMSGGGAGDCGPGTGCRNNVDCSSGVCVGGTCQ